MTLTNLPIGVSAYSLSAAGVCGFSTLVSFALSSPDNAFPAGGRHTLIVTNEGTTVPLHIEARSIVKNHLGSDVAVPIGIALLSNTQPFGSAQSAAQVQPLVMLLSGQDACIPLEGVVGNTLQIAVMPASNPTSATVVCGIVAVWRV